jgi:N-acetyl-anhydromuramyl-L-alanine amidase AmpD
MNNYIIRKCYLDIKNNTKIGGTTIGKYLASLHKNQLWEKRKNLNIDTIVIHYISAVEFAPKHPFYLPLILKIFCFFVVSSHYIILRNGNIFNLVPEDKKAWHAGGSIMPFDNRTNVNEFSIGIELVATQTSGFTKQQYMSCAWLCKKLEKKYNKKFIYVGHEHIAGKKAKRLRLRNDVKKDPGPYFNWSLFYDLLKKE